MNVAPRAGARLRVGLDVGGTKVLALAIDADEKVVGQIRQETNRGPEGVVTSAARAVEDLIAELGVTIADIGHVGLGMPGLVDARVGTVSHAVNLDIGPVPVPIRQQLSALLANVPVDIENDLNAGALGAAALLNMPEGDLAYLAIGTGMAAGLVLDGQLRKGRKGAAGEIGHIPVDPLGLPCPCGQRGCIETVASGTALARLWPSTGDIPPPKALFDAAASGDAKAIQIRDEFAQAVATAIRVLVLTCDVETIVLGGGVAELGEPLIKAVRAALVAQAAASPFLQMLKMPDRVRVLPGGSPVGAIGAALVGAGAAELWGSPAAIVARSSSLN